MGDGRKGDQNRIILESELEMGLTFRPEIDPKQAGSRKCKLELEFDLIPYQQAKILKVKAAFLKVYHNSM